MKLGTRKACIALGLAIAFGSRAAHAAVPEARAPSIKLQNYLRTQFPQERLERLLTAFIEQVSGVGFRHFGVAEDFDHGHVLFTEDLVPFAILYHTQEHAHEYHSKDPGGDFDYLNPLTRNWLQWLDNNDPTVDGQRIDNAAFYMKIGEEMNDHFTIFAEQLDSKLIGAPLVEIMQFRFKPIHCNSEDPNWFATLTKIKIQTTCYTVKNQTPTQLNL